MTTKLKIPLKRPLYPPDHTVTPPGDDVVSIKRVVSRAGFWPWGQFDDNYYNGFAHGQKNKLGMRIKGRQGVAGLQKRLGIEATGNWGKETHEKSLLIRVPQGLTHEGELIWDQYSINNYKGFEDLTPAEETVKDIFSWWNWFTLREPSVHYDQGRPISILERGQRPPHVPISDDCSGVFIGCAWLAGAKAPDPWYRYTGGGNTDSLVKGGIPISVHDIDTYCKTHYVGVFYGHSIWNTVHVVAAENSKKLYSHGKEAGPEIIYNNLYYHSHPLVAVRAYTVI